MEEIRELYQEIILDHNKNPKNYGELEHYNHSAEGFNPLCGDKIYVYLDVENDTIKDVSFTAAGCAISKASASVMTTILKGKTLKEANELFGKFKDMITADHNTTPDFENLGKLAVFAGVREFPIRVKCATLSWHTLLEALEKGDKLVSAE